MKYYAFGLNHQTAPVDIRESYEFSDSALKTLYASVQTVRSAEWLVLSTCNRTEVYMYGPEEATETIRIALARKGDLNLEGSAPAGSNGAWPSYYAFTFSGEEAIRHIIEVVSGIQSQIVGDAQILNQTKTAYRLASAAGMLGPWMHRLMHTAFATAKDVITNTGLSRTGASVACSSVETATRYLTQAHNPAPWTFAVLGGGHMAALVLKELAKKPDITATIMNRTTETARFLAGKFGAKFASWEDRYLMTSQVDVVISATGAPTTVLVADSVPDRKKETDALLIDIAVPRDIDPDLSGKSGYQVLNIDEVRAADDSNEDGLSLTVEMSHARAVCDAAAKDLMIWRREREALQSTIQTLYDTFEAVRSREVSHNLHRFGAESHGQVDRLTRSIMQKLLAIPVVRLKTMAATDMDLAERVQILNGLFERETCEE